MTDTKSKLPEEVLQAVNEMIRQLHEDRYYGPYRLDYVDSSGEPRSVLVRDDGSIEELEDEQETP